jgi:hypothetical protein
MIMICVNLLLQKTELTLSPIILCIAAFVRLALFAHRIHAHGQGEVALQNRINILQILFKKQTLTNA